MDRSLQGGTSPLGGVGSGPTGCDVESLQFRPEHLPGIRRVRVSRDRISGLLLPAGHLTPFSLKTLRNRIVADHKATRTLKTGEVLAESVA
jgi:hypothetical protein